MYIEYREEELFMPRLSVMGPPVHPILQAIPAAVLPASTTFDVLAYLSGSEA